MINKIKNYLNQIKNIRDQVIEIKTHVIEINKEVIETKRFLSSDSKSPKVNIGQIHSLLNNQKESINDLSEVEFQVFSQWGDDGIIQYLINKIDIPNKTFIEFGVEKYIESNTRFLLLNNNWTGYVIDGSKKNIDYIKSDIISWACELYVETAFITAKNINELIKKNNFDPEVGLLSIDVDGNDYWIWKAINIINPVIVIVEYNSVFGKNTTWTIPYDPVFVREEKHSSILYFGASLKSLVILAEQKGYAFIGSNSRGNNAYFIRKDKIGNFKLKTVDEGYVLSKFRETTIEGERVSGLNRIKLIEGLKVFDVQTNSLIKIDSSLVIY